MRGPSITTMAWLAVTFSTIGLVARAASCAADGTAEARATAAVEAPTSCYRAGTEVPPRRVSLDASCDALRCPPGSHAEWVVTLGRPGNVRCVEGP